MAGVSWIVHGALDLVVGAIPIDAAPLLQRLANFASRAGLREPLVVRHDSAPRAQPRAKLHVQ